MSSQRIYRTAAIVIHRRDQGEADRVLTLCTPLGKIAAIAKGVRRVRSRKAGHLELFVHAELSLARSRSSWDVISQAETVAAHAPLRDDLQRGTYARYVVELYDRFVAEGEGGPALFDLVARTLDYLCQGSEEEILMRAYEQRLLTLVGFRPELEHCVGEQGARLCGRAIEPTGDEPLGLDPERGGALCRECAAQRDERRPLLPLSPAALAFLVACQREPFSLLRQHPVTPALLAETERAARHYITYHLERELRSGVFLRRLRREEAWPLL